jgi:hypothetical protein
MSRVVHCKRELFDVYIGRGTKWGNPFVIGRDGDRSTVIAKYRRWIESEAGLMASIPELRGKVPCHGDVLVELLEEVPHDPS